jgi:hypothetical protein
MERARREGSEEELPLPTARYTQANWRAGAAREFFGRKTAARQMQAIRVGGIALLCDRRRNRLFEIGLRIAEASRSHTRCFSGYSNGGFGYIPTREPSRKVAYECKNRRVARFSGGAADAVVAEDCDIVHDHEGDRRMKLKDKVAIVTGASLGIGRARPANWPLRAPTWR